MASGRGAPKSVGNGPVQRDKDIVLEGNRGLSQRASDTPFSRGRGWTKLYEPVPPRSAPPTLSSLSSQRSGLLLGEHRVRVTEPTKFPFSTVCDLRFHDESGHLWGGTGTLVGQRVVLTAGHNVFDPSKNPRRGWFPNMQVIPGLDGDLANTPFPTVQTNVFRSTDLWTDQSSDQWDVGAILLPSPLGDSAGWMAIANLTTGTLQGLAVHIVGYPVDCPGAAAECGPPGTTMWMDAGNIVQIDGQFARYNVTTSAGDSGAPAIAVFPTASDDNQFQLVAVHTEGFDLQTNRGVRITPELLTLIQQWMADSVPS